MTLTHKLKDRRWLNRLLWLMTLLLLLIILYIVYIIFKKPHYPPVPFNCEACVVLPASCGPNHQQGILVNGAIVAANAISVEYNTPLSNKPAAYGNWMGIWEGNYIDYNKEPIASFALSMDERTGSVSFDKTLLKTGKNYIIGYGIGKDRKGLASTLFLPWYDKAFTPSEIQFTSIRPVSMGQNHLVIKYETPVGNKPEANGNWVGIQEGTTFTYGNNRFQRFFIKSDDHRGTQSINGYSFDCNQWYTVVYGMGSEKNDIVAAWTFHGSEAFDHSCLSCCQRLLRLEATQLTVPLSPTPP